jgi:hypothetical protein
LWQVKVRGLFHTSSLKTRQVKVDVYGEVFLSLHGLQQSAALGTAGPARALGHPRQPRRGWSDLAEGRNSSSPPPWRDTAPRFAAAFAAAAGAADRSGVSGSRGSLSSSFGASSGGGRGSSSSSSSSSSRRSGAPVLWLDAGGGAALAPLVVHGNGHGKRALRVLSCQLGLHCHWWAEPPAADPPTTALAAVAHASFASP